MGCFVFILRLRFVKTPALSLSRARTRNGNNCHRQQSSQKEKKPSYIALACENRQITARTKTTLVSQSLAGRDKATRLPRDTHTEKIQKIKDARVQLLLLVFASFIVAAKTRSPPPQEEEKEYTYRSVLSLSAFHQLLDGRRTEHEFLCVCKMKKKNSGARVCVSFLLLPCR